VEHDGERVPKVVETGLEAAEIPSNDSEVSGDVFQLVDAVELAVDARVGCE
jgi:hypothetical protein